MEKDAEVLRQKLLEEKKRREEVSTYSVSFLGIILLTNFQEENLAAEAELARQEEEKKLQAQKLESVSNLKCSTLVARVCTYIIM